MAKYSSNGIDTSTISGLREYYYVTEAALWRTYCQFEEHLDDRSSSILEEYHKLPREGREDAGIELHQIKDQSALVLRYAMLPRFLGSLERIVKAMCKIIDPQQAEGLDHRNWLDTHKDFLSRQGVDLAQVEEDFETIRNLNILRNCIVHANGEVDVCRDPNRVRESINQIKIAGILNDGFIWLEDQVIPTSQNAMSNILRHLFGHFGCPPDWTQVPG